MTTCHNNVGLALQILGASQLAGSPPIPEWDIPQAQYPSVALVNWTTGEGEACMLGWVAMELMMMVMAGNPRYWVLKLLIEEVRVNIYTCRHH